MLPASTMSAGSPILQPETPSGHYVSSGSDAADAQDDVVDLTQPDTFSDVTLRVEDRKLYTSRYVLASYSPVWRRMFESGFKEKDADEVALPGKTFAEVLELMLCLMPASLKPVTAENVHTVLPLADEYQISKLKLDCERVLVNQVKPDLPDEEQLNFLDLAQRYSLNTLLEHTTELLSHVGVQELERKSRFDVIEKQSLVLILRKRVIKLEATNAELDKKWKESDRQVQNYESRLKTLELEKKTIKETLHKIKLAYGKTDHSVRCDSHTAPERDFACETCTNRLDQYIRGELDYLLTGNKTRHGTYFPVKWFSS